VGRKKAAESERTARARILAAARRHFFAHGFRGVTMDDLAAELGMSKRTVYAHFGSKNEILEAMLQDKLASAAARLEQVTTTHADDFLAGLKELLATVLRETEEIRPPFMRDLQREAPELFERVELRRREVIRRQFGRLFEEGLKEGKIRKDVPVPVIIEVLVGAAQAFVNPGKLLEMGMTVGEGFTAITTLILEGALERGKGSKR
jgi:AcrR family transcriptional regulator